ncbi:MAG: carbohydrate kinase, partial [Propionibacterium sp.]|nr:carbohydrate kinase [Propionibacterium sp.]
MLRNLVEKVEAGGESIAVLGIGCHGDGAWLIDANGDQVRPGILSLDSRAIQTAARLNASVGDDLLRVTGQRVGPASPGVVLAWLKENEPESLQRARWFVAAKDFLRGMLTGSIGTDLTEASTAFTDVHTQQYSPEAFALYGLEELEAKAPPIAAPGDIVGGVSRLAHLATGLPEGLPVIAGLHDVDAGAIGAGAVRPGQLAVMAGTWSINEVISDRPVTGDTWFCRAFVERG